MLSGVMRIVVDGHEVLLHPGDSIYYDSRAPHAMACAENEPVHFLAMVIPE